MRQRQKRQLQENRRPRQADSIGKEQKIMEKSMKTALDAAVDDLLKDWNKEIKIKL